MSDEELLVEHEILELSAPFTQAFGAVLADGRLGDGELRLLLWIQFRSMNKGSNFASCQAYADDLGIDVSTVKRRLTTLKEGGYLRCERRGIGKTWTKILVAPSKLYNRRTLVETFSLMRSDRSATDIATLRSLDNDCGLKNEPSKGSDLSPRRAQKCALLSRTSEIEQEEVEQVFCGAESATSKTPGGPGDTPSNPETSVENQKNPDPEEAEAAARAAAARAALAAGTARNAAAAQNRQQRLERRQHAEESARVRKSERFSTHEANARTVENWFKAAISDHIGTFVVPRWGVIEMKLAKNLLQEFGAKLVEAAVIEVCKNWKNVYQARFKTVGLPGVMWLSTRKNMIFTEVQLQAKSDEIASKPPLTPTKKIR